MMRIIMLHACWILPIICTNVVNEKRMYHHLCYFSNVKAYVHSIKALCSRYRLIVFYKIGVIDTGLFYDLEPMS